MSLTNKQTYSPDWEVAMQIWQQWEPPSRTAVSFAPTLGRMNNINLQKVSPDLALAQSNWQC